MTRERQGPPPRTYAIRVCGHLGRTMVHTFSALEAQTRGEDTVLTVAIPYQAALHGVLADIEALGLELVEVRRIQTQLGEGTE